MLTVVVILALVGAVALVGSFVRMKQGIGPKNLKTIMCILLPTLVSILAALAIGK